MAPPSKRRKRSVVESSPERSVNSEDEAEVVKKGPSQTQLSNFFSSPASAKRITSPTSRTAQSSPNATPTKPKSKRPPSKQDNNSPNKIPNRARTKSSSTKSVTSSPEKKNGKGKQVEKGKSGDLMKLFSSQAQRQRKSNGATPSAGGSGMGVIIKEEEVEDTISDDDDLIESKVLQNSIVSAIAKKRGSAAMTGAMDVVSASQKFLRKPAIKTAIQKEEDMRPWADRFAPTCLEELAVHKRKVADVRSWLESVMEGRIRQRLLVLKGAAGTGKTTTIQLLAESLATDVLEWRNPGGTVATSEGFVSMASQFEEFIGRGGRFGKLDLISDEGAISAKPDTKPLDRRKNMILVEEFPNTFTRSSSALQSFRSVVLQYLASNTPSLASMYNKPSNKAQITPLIMVISETLLTTTSASADSFTAHRLLGPEVLQHPGVTVIEFNAIAPTLLAKALELVVLKESRKSGRRKTPGPLVLKRLGEIGDVRSAIGSLEFLCLRGDDDDWGSKVTFGKGKKPTKDSVPLTKMEMESLELVTRREASLGIFHAVGKVVYNKRDDIPEKDDVECPPAWLSRSARPRRSQVDVDTLIDETGTDTQTFIAALHENYILSCDASPGSLDFTDLDHVNGCMDALSDSDLLCPSWDGSFNSTGFGGGTGGRGSGGDILRQDELCFQIAVRGILFSLPNPVKRKAPAAAGLRTGRSNDAFKMFYPTSLKLWRMKEEIEGIIDMWVTRLMKGEGQNGGGITSGAAAFARPKPGSVESWKGNREIKAAKEKDAVPLLSIGTSARKEMLLERLPYMIIMARVNRGTSSTFSIREMEKVTSFTGIGSPNEESTEDGEDGPVTEEWATDRPVEGESPKKKRVVGIKRGTKVDTIGLENRFAEQRLVLSDDDIEDD